MSARHHSPLTRATAIADYYASGDPASTVAKRHGIPRATFAAWVTRRGEDDLAYEGGWEVRGAVRYPLFPERRSA